MTEQICTLVWGGSHILCHSGVTLGLWEGTVSFQGIDIMSYFGCLGSPGDLIMTKRI